MAASRTCVGCRSKREYSLLLRFRYPESRSGRGAWVCKGSRACFEMAVSRKSFDRALKVPVPMEVLTGWSRYFDDATKDSSAPSLY